ncbi:hypothetical protein U9M48_042666 [Paspalum notatum var. saurae]|uniref:Reverse transcriptase domain-containing protein n=1 Tax=Paspalum notatum var. saurae TaxID=547442 RepID=A0AAQ3URA9_PASNO
MLHEDIGDIYPPHLHSLNFGTIILLSKRNDVRQIQQYRPMCLLNLSFKIFTKIATNRIAKIASKIIKPSQTAFLPGRNIMEGAVILYETIPELHTNKQNGVIFKIDFEKAYDKISWYFLQQVLRTKGFSPKLCGFNPMSKGPIKGLRHGDPLSPILYNIMVDMLALIIARANNNGQVKGAIPQYADDTVIFLDHDLEQSKTYEIDFIMRNPLCGVVWLQTGSYPFRYLGLSMYYKKILNEDWKMIEDRIEKRLCNWKGNMLFYSGRLVLLNSVLSSLPIFMLSFFEVLKKLNTLGLDFSSSMIIPIDKVAISMSTQRPRRFGSSESRHSEQISVQFKLSKWKPTKVLRRHMVSIAKKHANVAEVLNSSPLNISFRRALHNLVASLAHVNLEDGTNIFIWGLHKQDSFTMKSMYTAHISNGINMSKEIWGLRIPFTIKFFPCWHKQWSSNLASLLLTGGAAFYWTLWLTRNDTVSRIDGDGVFFLATDGLLDLGLKNLFITHGYI